MTKGRPYLETPSHATEKAHREKQDREALKLRAGGTNEALPPPPDRRQQAQWDAGREQRLSKAKAKLAMRMQRP